MAHIREMTIVIKISKLVKEKPDLNVEDLVSSDVLAAFETVVGELLGDSSLIVELKTE